jgi:YD repeat-containing protein
VWTLAYSGVTSISYIENPAAMRTTFHYASNKLQAIQDLAGRRTTLTVSANNLATITSAELCLSQFVYDGSGRLDATISPAGHRWTYSYDGSGRVSNVTYPGGDKTTYAYSTSASLVTTVYTNQRAKVTTLVHAATDGLLQTIIDPNGKRTTLTWSGKRVSTVKNPLNQVTSFTYKTFSTEGVKFMETVLAPSGPPNTIVYDDTVGAPPRVEAVQYPDGNLSTLHWNATTNLKVDAVQDPMTHRTSFMYDAFGDITDVGNAMAETITYQYDSQCRLEAMVDPLSKRTTYTYNSYSQVETIKNPLNKVWTFTRDKVNRLTEEINPLGNRTTYTYGANCLVQTVKNPARQGDDLPIHLAGSAAAGYQPVRLYHHQFV